MSCTDTKYHASGPKPGNPAQQAQLLFLASRTPAAIRRAHACPAPIASRPAPRHPRPGPAPPLANRRTAPTTCLRKASPMSRIDEEDHARGARVEIAIRAAQSGDLATAAGILAGMSSEERDAIAPLIAAAAGN